MERQISVGIFRPKYVDHLQRWSRIFRSKETETVLSIWIPTEITGIFGIMESTLCLQMNVKDRVFELRRNGYERWLIIAVIPAHNLTVAA